MTDPADFVGVAFLWLAMFVALFGARARRWQWNDTARFCDGMACGFALSGVILLLVLVQRKAGR